MNLAWAVGPRVCTQRLSKGFMGTAHDYNCVPAKLGFAMPAEWDRHAATWLAWPHHRADWPGKFGPIPWIFAEIVRLISAGEVVHILAQNAAQRLLAKKILNRNQDEGAANVRFHICPTDRIWTRDSGPSMVRRGRGRTTEVAAVGWQFNAWAKYKNYLLDQHVPRFIARESDLRLYQPVVAGADGKPRRFVLEGGSIDVNGVGCVLTTEECLLSGVQQRNPGLDQAAVEQTLCDFLGVQKVLWLGQGIAGDDTHGHIDDTARFTGPSTIVACVEPKKQDPNHDPLAENMRRLKKMRDHRGHPFDLAELPMPKPVIFDGQRLPASYANFYVCNAAVLVPVFNDPADSAALKVLEGCFTDRPVIPVYCRDMAWGLGTLHCMTQQQPAAADGR